MITVYNLECETEDRRYFDEDSVALPYVVEALNLSYRIETPRSISVLDLGRFIGNWILSPLAFYTRTAPYPSMEFL